MAGAFEAEASPQQAHAAAAELPAALPRWARPIVNRLLPQVRQRDVDLVEVFSGRGQLAAAFRDGNYQVATFDIVDNPQQDATTLQGIFYLIILILRVVPGGLVWLAPPCQLWTFMASSVHKRTRSAPAGDTSNTKVREANQIARVVAAVILLAHSRGARVFVEQPRGSHLFRYKYVARAFHHIALSQRRRAPWRRVITYMGAFGGPLVKPLEIWTTARFGQRLARLAPEPPPEMQRSQYYTVVGSKSVTGKKKLAESGHYTRAFGEAVLQYYILSKAAIAAEVAAEAQQPFLAYPSDESDMEL